MAVPGAVLQVCAIVSYPLGFANANSTPNIGILALVDPVDAGSPGILMRVERCSGAGCTSWGHIGNSLGVHFIAGPADPQAEFIDTGAFGAIYRYRVQLQNADGTGPFSSIIEIDTTLEGTSVCDTGSTADLADHIRGTGGRLVTESTADHLSATGTRLGTEWTLDKLQATGLRLDTDFLLTQVQATGLRFIVEYIESSYIDLVVEKSNNNPTPFPGDFITWTVVVSNVSTNDATGVVLNDILPEGVFFDSYVASQGTYDPVSGSWDIGDLDAGDSATIDIVVLVGLIGPDPGDEEICNYAIATSNEPELTPENNFDLDCIVVQPPVEPPTGPCIPDNPPPVPPLPPGECPPRTPPDTLNYSVPFRLYQKDVEVRIKSWGDDTAYAIVRPYGGPSFERGAAI